MNHFNEDSETTSEPDKATRIIGELTDMFGFHPSDKEQPDPSVEKTLDDDTELKEAALAKVEELLKIRQSEASKTEATDTLARTLQSALDPNATLQSLVALQDLLEGRRIIEPVSLPDEQSAQEWHRTWLIPGWLPTDTATLFSAKGGMGKSYLVLQQISMLTMGYADCWLSPEKMTPAKMTIGPINVVIANWEDEPEEAGQRISRICQTMKWADYNTIREHCFYVDMKRGGNVWGVGEGAPGFSASTIQEAGRRILEICEQKEARLLVLDPLSGAFGGNEIDRADVYRFVSEMRAWAQRSKCAVLMAAHIPADETKKYSGSTAWTGAVRSAWYLGAETEKTGTGRGAEEKTWWQLEQLKANYARPQPPIYLYKNDNGVWIKPDSKSEVQAKRKAQVEYENYRNNLTQYKSEDDESFIHHTKNDEEVNDDEYRNLSE